MVNLFIIGEAKCGTTFLWSVLQRLPETVRSFSDHPYHNLFGRKELHFFDGMNINKGLSWYNSIFKESDGIKIDASPSYLSNPFTPRLVHEYNSKAKIIVMVREPVERVVSHYNWLIRKAKERGEVSDANESIEDMIEFEFKNIDKLIKEKLTKPMYFSRDPEGATFRKYSLVRRSRYINNIRNWQKYFKKSQILVVDSREIFKGDFSKVFDFLNVDPLENILELPHKKNKNPFKKNYNPPIAEYFEQSNLELKNEFGIEY
jgi:hypothetical protein